MEMKQRMEKIEASLRNAFVESHDLEGLAVMIVFSRTVNVIPPNKKGPLHNPQNSKKRKADGNTSLTSWDHF